MEVIEKITVLVLELKDLDQWHKLLAFWPLPEDQDKATAMNDRFWDRGTPWQQVPDVVVKTAVLDAYHEALAAAIKAIRNGMTRAEGTAIYESFPRTPG